MIFFKNAMITAKSMPKWIWITALILPGGFTAIGVWLFIKSLYRTLKG